LPQKLRMRAIRLFAGTLTVEKGVMWEPEFSFFFALDPKMVLKPEV
jgi:hypothetical protein